MLYTPTTHPRLSVGQRWACAAPSKMTATIVALDSFPGGLALNVVLEDEAGDPQVVRALVPIDWAELEPHLDRVVETCVDVSEHMSSYREWKEAAERGEAGIFTLGPQEILALLRETVRSGSPVS